MFSFFLKRDSLIISCDTIADFPLSELFDFHEIKESELTSLFLSPLQTPENVKLPGPKSKIKIGALLFLIIIKI